MEILSPGDESYVKLDWYADLGVREMFVVNGMVWSEVLQAGFITLGPSGSPGKVAQTDVTTG